MNEIEHAFPLPEAEAHKLDEMKLDTGKPPAAPPQQRFDSKLRRNIWKLAGTALAVGLVCGFFYGRARG